MHKPEHDNFKGYRKLLLHYFFLKWRLLSLRRLYYGALIIIRECNFPWF